jgi:hypothetical protein
MLVALVRGVFITPGYLPLLTHPRLEHR